MIFPENTLIKQPIKIMIKKPINKTIKPSCTSFNPGHPDSDNDISREYLNKTTNKNHDQKTHQTILYILQSWTS
ncbi:hypothetical protein OA07_08130 [Aphanizomenon flos-aquae 2012/KM1/D3]|nr:hypothetical protein OA07_08130 [Aphanizomenon flos-aquae 2012/KM1/D3]